MIPPPPSLIHPSFLCLLSHPQAQSNSQLCLVSGIYRHNIPRMTNGRNAFLPLLHVELELQLKGREKSDSRERGGGETPKHACHHYTFPVLSPLEIISCHKVELYPMERKVLAIRSGKSPLRSFFTWLVIYDFKKLKCMAAAPRIHHQLM